MPFEITTLGLAGGLEQRTSPLENPNIPLSSPALWQWLTGGEPTAAGELVTEINALQVVAVYRCVTFIAEAIASLPCEQWDNVPAGREKATSETVHYLLTEQPNPEMSAFDFKETLIGCEVLTGNGYAQIERDRFDDPVGLWPLHPHLTKPVRVTDGPLRGQLAYKTGDGMALGETRIVPAADVIHLKRFSLDGMLGLSPIGVARQAIGLAKATEKFGARFFGNNTRPGGVIFNKGQKPKDGGAEFVESWNRQQGGNNQGKTAFLFGGEWDYKQIGLSPEDSQFLGTRQMQRAEIATLFGLMPNHVGDTSRLSGANSEQENLRVLTDTLRPYMTRAEGEFNRKLLPAAPGRPRKSFVKFDPAERLTVDFKTSQDGYAAGVQWGWYSPNDVRRKQGENPGPVELDVYRVPVNMQSAKTLLTTESIQDQPIGGLPAKTGADPADPEMHAPTTAERKLLGVYTRSFLSVYRDAFGRLARRSKRDATVIDGIFRPVLRSLAGLAVEQNEVIGDADLADRVVADVLKAMEKRAAKWPASIPAAEVDTYAGAEFLKAVRSIHIATSREWAGIRAAREVEGNDAE